MIRNQLKLWKGNYLENEYLLCQVHQHQGRNISWIYSTLTIAYSIYNTKINLVYKQLFLFIINMYIKIY